MAKKEVSQIERILEDTPQELKAVVLIGFLKKVMRKNSLTWLELSKQLIGEHCLICGSQVLACEQCGRPISIGLENQRCVSCGKSFEKLQIEPQHR